MNNVNHDVNFKVSVVLPAGGTGARMKLKEPKQYIKILGQPMLLFVMEAYNRIPWIDKVVVTVRDEYIDGMRNLASQYRLDKVVVTYGGSPRHSAIYEGIKALDSEDDKPDIVIIQDAVRLHVDENIVKHVVQAATESGASGVMNTLQSSVVEEDENGKIISFKSRDCHCSVEMPQAFLFDHIKETYDEATEDEMKGWTSCLQIVQNHRNLRPKLVKGDNFCTFKVTHQKDLPIAEDLMKRNHLCISIDRSNENISDAIIKKWQQMCPMHDRTIPNRLVKFHCIFDLDEITTSTKQLVCQDQTMPLVRPMVVHLIQEPCASHQYSNMMKMFSDFQDESCIVHLVVVMRPVSSQKIAEVIVGLLWSHTSSGNITFIGRE